MNTISDLVDEAAARFPTRAVLTVGGAIRSLAELPDLGAAFNVELLWRHHLAALAAAGLDVPTGADGS